MKKNTLLPKTSMLFLSIFAVGFAYGSDKTSKPSPQQGQEQTSLPQSPPTVAAYNGPARIETQHPYNVYTEISFNYWQPIQENMELGVLNNGTTSSITLSGLTTVGVASSDSFRNLNMSFHYKPGFTLGVGVKLNEDGWDARLAYTWFHNTHRKGVTASNFALFHTEAPNIVPTWGTLSTSETNPVFQSASEKWKLGMDILDLDLGRWYFVGRKLTFHPSVGARAAFIQQNVHVSYIFGFANFTVDVPGLLGSGVLVENKDVFAKSRSWALGPKLALETNWALKDGFRFFGNGEVDLLYTRYTSLKESTITNGTVAGSINLIPFSFTFADDRSGRQRDVGCLRTHLDLELGLGWGTYFNHNRFYIDCSAGYEFQVFFDQNMFRHDIDDPGSFIPNGNLYIQGLTAKARLDF